MEKVSVIIPVKDEEVGLEFLLGDFESSNLREKFDIDFFFVIDGRTNDNSREIARVFSNQLIDQKETHGKGSAVRQAIQIWAEDRSPKVVFLDADGSYSFQAVSEIIAALDGDADVISGSRFLRTNHRPEGMSRLHNFGNKVLSFISSIRNGRKITDLCTGLWGFNQTALEKMEFRSEGFDLEAEIAGLVRRNDLIHVEIPVDWSQRKGGNSKLRSIRDGLIILLRILRT